MLLGYSNVLGSGTGEPHPCYARVSPRTGACACHLFPPKGKLFFHFCLHIFSWQLFLEKPRNQKRKYWVKNSIAICYLEHFSWTVILWHRFVGVGNNNKLFWCVSHIYALLTLMSGTEWVGVPDQLPVAGTDLSRGNDLARNECFMFPPNNQKSCCWCVCSRPCCAACILSSEAWWVGGNASGSPSCERQKKESVQGWNTQFRCICCSWTHMISFAVTYAQTFATSI